jgi:ubiquinone biosynthesis protein COQ9
MSETMDDQAFDAALVRAAFDLAAEVGWRRLRVAEAARRAGLPLDRARLRFPGNLAVLLRFGRLADAAALRHAAAEGPVRDRLFDILMQRFEFLQAHRSGVLALLRLLPCAPPLALLLHRATRRSMGWMLEGAGISAAGLEGRLRAKGLEAVWLWTVQAWRRDDSEDLSATMSALDKALTRAEGLAACLPGRRRATATEEPAADEQDASMAQGGETETSPDISATDEKPTPKPEPEPPESVPPT